MYDHVDDFDYDLPASLIAQFPPQCRTDSRLLVSLTNDQPLKHAQFSDVLYFIHPNDLVIFNDTRVMQARLYGQKKSGGKVSALIERVLNDHHALVHVKSSHAPKPGVVIRFENAFDACVIARQDDLFELEFLTDQTILTLLEQHGRLPLPPYITRDVKPDDLSRYQTIYANTLGAVAAPTAGLHFDDALLTQLKNKTDVGFLTLHVGAGTFQPVRTEKINEHVMHHEYVIVSEKLCTQIQACRARGGRVIAVGTTVVRALESAALSGTLKPFSGDTNIFITPGFQFSVVDALITNFHLPKSTLLMLVCAFAGFDRIMHAYREAIAQQYRFFSYGDAMLLNSAQRAR